MGKKEFALWGTKNGYEDIIRINGKEVQNSRKKAQQYKNIISSRGEFKKVRIQTIDHSSDLSKSFKNKRLVL